MNRPRFTISVLRGLLSMNSLASAELMNFSPDEQRDMLDGPRGSRDYHRAAEWLISMRHWYMRKGEQP